MVPLSLSIALLLLGMLLPVGLTLWMLAYAARAATVMVGRCGRCGYDLRGLEPSRQDGRCPECGHPYRVLSMGPNRPPPGEEASLRGCAPDRSPVSSSVSPPPAGRRASEPRA